jgi:Ca-activated chloride channel family protein
VGAEVTVDDILAAAEAGDLRFAMTSASQSNSGASAYLGFLSAFAGAPEVLRSQDLRRPEVTDRITRLLGSVERSSGSSGWLNDLLLRDYDAFDAMVNYEALVIEANQQLVARGDEPLYAVYPVDGLAIADSPLGYVDRGDGDERRRELFGRLQEYLLSPPVQQEILGLGRRVGAVGMRVDDVDEQVFNPEWGIDVERPISPIRIPDAAVIREALDLYQTSFRKPSFTVYCLDYSWSMEGDGQTQLLAAMETLLDPALARRNLLQIAPDDTTVVIPFDGLPRAPLTVEGNGEQDLAALLSQVETTPLGDATNIYDPVAEAFRIMDQASVEGRFPAVILMTDGEANAGSFDALRVQLDHVGLDGVPVYAILFGSASEAQVTEITELTGGRVFDGREDLIEAFRTAKGYN